MVRLHGTKPRLRTNEPRATARIAQHTSTFTTGAVRRGVRHRARIRDDPSALRNDGIDALPIDAVAIQLADHPRFGRFAPALRLLGAARPGSFLGDGFGRLGFRRFGRGTDGPQAASEKE
jgi:hypothetical protein